MGTGQLLAVQRLSLSSSTIDLSLLTFPILDEGEIMPNVPQMGLFLKHLRRPCN